MKQHANHFDVIIVDASDPVGPADVLFEQPFYLAMKAALRAGGIVATQGENMWLHADLIANVLRFCREGGFRSARYAWATVSAQARACVLLLTVAVGAFVSVGLAWICTVHD
jgi:spermidine synthase